MQASEDDLWSRFAASRSERAFQDLVQRHLSLVHSVALRTVRDPELAREVSQQTFIRLFQQAGRVHGAGGLLAWLHRTSRSLAVDAVRREERRRRRERKAALLMSTLGSTDAPETAWESVAPVIDRLLDRLSRRDREVLLLRYYENRSIAAVAGLLGITEHAASKRALRALDRLRGLFAKRGIATSASALATLLPLHGAALAPAGLSISIGTAAFAAAPAGATGLLATFFTMTTSAKIAVAASAVLILTLTAYRQGRLSAERDRATAAAPHPVRALSGEEGGESARRFSSRTVASRPASDPLSRLDRIVKIDNAFQRQRALSAFLAALPQAEFPAVGAKLYQLDLTAGSDEMRLFVAAWSSLDPQAALGFASEPPQPDLIRLVVGEWLQQDAAAAYQWASHDSGFDPRLRQSVLEQVIAAGVTADPLQALARVRENPDMPGLGGSIVAEILARRPGELENLLARLPDAGTREQVVEMASEGVRSRSREVIERTEQDGKTVVKVSAVLGWGSVDVRDRKIVEEWFSRHPEFDPATKPPTIVRIDQ